MIGPWGRLKGVRVAARAAIQIRDIALAARVRLRVDAPRVNMADLLENALRKNGIHYHIVEQARISGEAARAEPETGRILVAADAYDGICAENPAHQLLIPHELAHFVLRHAITFARSISGESHSLWEDSEVQADFFSHEFTMPAILLRRHCQSAVDIMRVFNVPKQDAEIRARVLRQEGDINWG